MKIKSVYLLIIALFFTCNRAMAWGFLGHKTINNRAVYSLPVELFGFYKQHIDYVTLHSVDPDSRRYLYASEGCKHYIDCDHYEKAAPLDTIPHFWFAAVEKYTEDSLNAHGIVPWNCVLMLKLLTKAFEEKNVSRILKLSSDIGHYIADASVPLHSTSNYNGQKTGQEGIHALWETRIPQLYLDSFDLLTGTVVYIKNPTEFIWKIVGESFAALDTVLSLEKKLTENNEAKKYSIINKGRGTEKNYSVDFCKEYNEKMDNMVSRRMNCAIYAVAAFWYTAWVDAGMPDLSVLEMPAAEDEGAVNNSKENKKIKGRDEPGSGE